MTCQITGEIKHLFFTGYYGGGGSGYIATLTYDKEQMSTLVLDIDIGRGGRYSDGQDTTVTVRGGSTVLTARGGKKAPSG